jgi:hypothetical protein
MKGILMGCRKREIIFLILFLTMVLISCIIRYTYTKEGYNKGFEAGWYCKSQEVFPSVCANRLEIEYQKMERSRETFNGF